MFRRHLGWIVAGIVVVTIIVITVMSDNARKATEVADAEASENRRVAALMNERAAQHSPTPARDYNAEITDPKLRAENERNLKILAERSQATPTATMDSAPEIKIPRVNGFPVPPVTYESEADKVQLQGLTYVTNESVDEMAFLTDAAARTVIMRTNHGPRSPSRQEFLYIIAGVVDDSNDKESVRKKYGLSKANGKYRFAQLRDAALKDIAMANRKGMLLEDLLGYHR